MWCPNLNVEAPFRGAPAGLNTLRKKATNNVILRRQQAPKNLHFFENAQCRSFVPQAGLKMTGLGGLFPQPVKPRPTKNGFLPSDELAARMKQGTLQRRADGGRVLIIEYEVHGTVLATGVEYNNRFCSIVHLKYRKISHGSDYMDSFAAWNVLAARAR
jgi:hypothetical protein